jgi:hypothetical protein
MNAAPEQPEPRSETSIVEVWFLPVRRKTLLRTAVNHWVQMVKFTVIRASVSTA